MTEEMRPKDSSIFQIGFIWWRRNATFC